MLPQKALHLYVEEQKKKPNIHHDYIVSEKLDGWYTYVDCIPNGLEAFYSRSGRPIPAFDPYLDTLRSLARTVRPLFEDLGVYKFRIICEAVIPEVDFHTANGLFNRTRNIVSIPNLRFYIHDIVPMKGRECAEGWTALARMDLVWQMNKVILNLGYRYFSILPILGITSDKAVWMQHFRNVVDCGGEGVVLKQTTGVYSPGGRNSSLMKIKLEETFDLLCVGVMDTVGEKGHPNKNLVLRDSAGIEIQVRLGAYADLETIERESPVGNVVEIKCMAKLPDGSYREPRFKAFRWDISPADID
jgi:hypothetical protein